MLHGARCLFCLLGKMPSRLQILVQPESLQRMCESTWRKPDWQNVVATCGALPANAVQQVSRKTPPRAIKYMICDGGIACSRNIPGEDLAKTPLIEHSGQEMNVQLIARTVGELFAVTTRSNSAISKIAHRCPNWKIAYSSTPCAENMLVFFPRSPAERHEEFSQFPEQAISKLAKIPRI